MRSARAALLGVVACVVAWLGGRIFDEQQWALYLAALAPIVAGRLLARAPRAVLAIGLVGSVVAATAVAVFSAGGGIGDLATTVTNGLGRLLSTEWPSPTRPEIVGIVALIVASAAALAAWLSASDRLHLAPLLPLLIAGVTLSAFAAPAGPPTAGMAVGGAAALAFAASNSERWSAGRSGGDRSAFATLLAVVLVGAVAAVVVDREPRADPRDDHPPVSAPVNVDPLDVVEALRAITPPIPLFSVSVEGQLASPSHWQLLAADTYDGERWTSSAALRPIGNRLAASGPDDVHVRLSYETNRIDLVPLPGEPVTVDAGVSTDAARAFVRLDDPPSEGDVVTATVRPFESDVADTALVQTRPIDPEAAELTDLAVRLAGEGTTIQKLRAIESALHDDYRRIDDDESSGVQQALITQFLREAQRGGTAEQFVSGFVLLARAIGADARVAAGFVLPEGADALMSDTAEVWPEVYVEGTGWVMFSPVPDQITDAADDTASVQHVTPIAPQPPPSQQTPDQTVEPPDTDTPPPSPPQSAWSEIAQWAGRIVGGIVLIVAPFALAALVIVLLKRRRRRRQLGAESPPVRARGAWAAANDVMVDAGLHIDRSWTDRQIASAAGERFDGSGERLRRLGDLSAAATFAGDPSAAVATLDERPTVDAVAEMELFEQDVLSSMTRRRRLRYRLSLRSLRRRSSSPVSSELRS